MRTPGRRLPDRFFFSVVADAVLLNRGLLVDSAKPDFELALNASLPHLHLLLGLLVTSILDSVLHGLFLGLCLHSSLFNFFGLSVNFVLFFLRARTFLGLLVNVVLLSGLSANSSLLIGVFSGDTSGESLRR